jgi:hypothetical protein
MCGEDKDDSEYYPDTHRGDGLSGYCRPCGKRRAGVYHQAMVALRERHRPEFEEILSGLWLSRS